MAGGEDLPDRAELIKIDLCGFPIPSVVANPGSPARAQGADLVFLVCSRDCATAIRLAAVIDADGEGRAIDPAAEILDGLRRMRPSDVGIQKNVDRMEHFQEIVMTDAPHIARQLGFDTLPIRSCLEPREEMEALFNQTCAWCLRQISEGAQIEGLHVWLVDNTDRVQESGFIGLTIGDRTVAARLADADSLMAATCDAVFILCGKSCAAALHAAIDVDRRLKVAH